MRWDAGKGRGAEQRPCLFLLRGAVPAGCEARKILQGLDFKRVKFRDGGLVHRPFDLETGGSGEKKA
jgi:hypothetical protein